MSLHQQLRTLREQKATSATQAAAFFTTATTAGRALSAEERASVERIHTEIRDEINPQIELLERQLAIEAETAERAGARAESDDAATGRAVSRDPVERAQQEGQAFRMYLRRGEPGLGETDRQILSPFRADMTPDQRATMTVGGGGASGGYLVPATAGARFEIAKRAFGGVLQVATPLNTATGEDWTEPSLNDTGNLGERIGEDTESAEQEAAIGTVTFKAYTYGSKVVPISFELLQDDRYDLEGKLVQIFGERIGRKLNVDFTTGTGVSMPKGIVVDAVLGGTGAAAQLTNVLAADMKRLMISVDPAYRNDPRAGFMFTDAVLSSLWLEAEDSGKPLWQPSTAEGIPDRILAKPYTINPDMAVPAASAKSVLFGFLPAYNVRNIQDLAVYREDKVTRRRVNFVAYQRHDGRMVNAGTNPVKYFQHAAA